MHKKLTKENIAAGVVGWLLIGAHFFVFGRFFPNVHGLLGNDYAYNMPLLLDGYYWYLKNGFFSLPWFSPSFCGGMPLLANPATFYVSVPQFFTFFIDPLSAVRLTFVLFAALGFWGFYLLLRRNFRTTSWSALLGGGLFLFNGFYSYRLIVGHIEFHSFMLVPWLALFLINNGGPERRLRSWYCLCNAMFSAMILAYMFMCGMAQLILPSLLGVLVVILVRKMQSAPFGLIRSLSTLALGGLLSLGLSAAKLVAALSFLGNLPRDSYLMPGVDGVFKLWRLLLHVLTMGGGGIDIAKTIVNSQWNLGPHEFEFGLSLTPVVLLGLAMVLNREKLLTLGSLRKTRKVACLAGILVILAIPLLLNYYSPAWNHFLKTVPLVKSLSNFFRWFIIYIPLVVVVTVLAVERTELLRRWVVPVTILSLLLTIGQNLFYDKGFYNGQDYDFTEIVTAYEAAPNRGSVPPITDLVISFNEKGQPIIGKGDVLAKGKSQLFCYEPMFGFQLEFLPFKTLHPGPVLRLEDGIYNLKNPACYLYPEENNCLPGDHFRASQRQEAELFTNRQPFAYEVSALQKWGDRVNIFSLVLIISALIIRVVLLFCDRPGSSA